MIIHKEQILKAIKAVKPSLGKDKDYYIKDGYLTATNDKCVSKYKLDGEIEDVRIPAKAIPLISSMSGDINIIAKKGSITISAGNSRATYKIESSSAELLDKNIFKSYMDTDISADVFNKAINKLIGIIPTASQRPVLEGMNVVMNNDNIEFMACDGVRIGWMKTAATVDVPISFIIPRDSLKSIESMGFAGEVIIKVGENWITFTDKEENKILYSRIIEGDYLEIGKLFDNLDLEYKADRNSFIDMLDKATLISEDNAAKIVLTIGERAEIEYKADLTEYSDSVILTAKNEKVEKSFNLNFLRDCINALFDDEMAIYTTNSPRTAIVFGDSIVKTLLLPVYTGR